MLYTFLLGSKSEKGVLLFIFGDFVPPRITPGLSYFKKHICYIFFNVSGLHVNVAARPLWLTKLRLYLAPADAAVPVGSFIR